MKKISFLSIISTLIIASCTSLNPPKLVIVLVSDQADPNILDKYDHLFTGGFRWLIDNGIIYNDAHLNHGNTITAAGHFSLSTGVYPGKEGIIDNEWYDRDLKRSYYAV